MKKGRRILATVLSLVVVLANLVGGGITAKAEVGGIQLSKNELDSKGGKIQVTVTPDFTNWEKAELKYRVRPALSGNMFGSAIKEGTCATTGIGTGDPVSFEIELPANTGEEDLKYQIQVAENSGSGWSVTTVKDYVTVKAGGGATSSVDKTALKKAIDDAGALKETDYTADSWNKLKTALEEAKSVDQRAEATEQEVSKATSELEAAIKALVVDKTALNQAIQDAEALKQEDYTAKSWASLQAVLAEARSTAGKGTATAAEVAQAVTELKAAVQALEKKQQQGDTKKLVIHVVDKQGRPVDDCGLAVVDTSFVTGYEGMAKKPTDGKLTVTATGNLDFNTKKGEVRLHSSSKADYTATPEKIEFTMANSEFKTVNGEAYDGTKEYTITVERKTVVQKSVDGVTAITSGLPSEGGKSKILVTGTGLVWEDMNIQIEEGGGPVTLAMVHGDDTPTMQSFTVTFPENKEETAKVYTIKVAADKTSSDFKSATVTVTAYTKPEEPGPGPSGPSGKEGTVTAIEVKPTEIPAAGAAAELKVTGTDLAADNWGVEVKAYIAGTDLERENLKAEVTNVTAEGATITFPANSLVNEVEYRITAGAKKDGVIQNQATATVTQAGKERSVTVDPQTVIQTDSRTIVVTFDQELTAAADAEALKDLIFVADMNDENANRNEVGDGGSVTVSGNQLTIVFEKELTHMTSRSGIYIREGALRTKEGALAKEIKWAIQSGPMVTEITLDQQTFDWQGGHAVARLIGTQLDQLAAGDIVARIFMAENSEATETPVKVTAGAVPSIEYDVPANNTDKTQCYLLRVTVNGVPVYEGAGLNPAKKAVVSVLPKSVADTEQTLGGLTITGMNTTSEGGELKDVSVVVSSNVGELKVLLRLYGTNLDSSKTRVRAIDENGIVWPVWDIAECDGTFRFVAIAYNGHGVVGDGNSQLIEVLPPRFAGTNKHYTLQVALDGEHFLTDPSVTLTVNNEGIKNDPEFVSCGPDDIRTITVRHVEAGTGKELVQPDVYKGYSISMLRGYSFAPKTIKGYELAKSPDIPLGDNDFITNVDREFVYEYRAVSTVENPSGGNPSGSNHSSGGQNTGNQTNTANKPASGSNPAAPQTGDPAVVWPYMLSALSSLAVMGRIGRRKRK